MKTKYKWIFLTITIIVIIGLIINFAIQRNNGSNKNNASDINDNNHIYKFKIFEYEVPEGLKFSDYKNNRFKVEGNDWYAIVGMIYDRDKKIYNDVECFQARINEFIGDTIDDSSVMEVNDVEVFVFQKKPSKSLLCYFATDFDVDYEAEIFNQDGSYKTDALNELIEPLLNFTYENDGSNDFYIGHFE